MNSKDTLKYLQSNIIHKMSFCPMPPQIYNEILLLFKELNDYINDNFEVKEENLNNLLLKENKKLANKLIEYEQVNLKLNTIIESKRIELNEIKNFNEQLIDAKNKLQASMQFRLKEIDELKSKKSIDIESILERQESFNNAVHDRINNLEKEVSKLKNQNIPFGPIPTPFFSEIRLKENK